MPSRILANYLAKRDGLAYVNRQSMPVDMTLSGLLPAWNSLFVFSSEEPAAQPSMFGEQSQIFSFSLGLVRLAGGGVHRSSAVLNEYRRSDLNRHPLSGTGF